MKQSIALIIAAGTFLLVGCSTPGPRNLKQEFAAQEAEALKLGPGSSHWFYTGTALGIHHLVLSHQNKTNDGRIAEHAYMTEVPVSQFVISDQFPLTHDESRWREIDSPAR